LWGQLETVVPSQEDPPCRVSLERAILSCCTARTEMLPDICGANNARNHYAQAVQGHLLCTPRQSYIPKNYCMKKKNYSGNPYTPITFACDLGMFEYCGLSLPFFFSYLQLQTNQTQVSFFYRIFFFIWKKNVKVDVNVILHSTYTVVPIVLSLQNVKGSLRT